MRSEFRLTRFQNDAIEILQRKEAHLIAVAPTGSGKSAIYEVCAQNPGTRTLLITPLIALGRQQVARLNARGVVARLGMGEDADRPVQSKGPSAWIVSPERLFPEGAPELRSRFRDWVPNLLVVDECHCLWDWGHSFRPAFLRIPSLLAEWGLTRSVWMTATLPLSARRMLLEVLPKPTIELGHFDLPESLSLWAVRVPWVSRSAAMLGWVERLRKEYGPQGIIFAQTRATSERVKCLLESLGYRVGFYHAGLAHEERVSIEASLKSGDLEIVVATSAFGMGMDLPGLSWTLLWQAPLSILALAQAIGRVGRAGRKAKSVVLWDFEDESVLHWAPQEDLKDLFIYLNSFGCRRSGLIQYFEGKTGDLFQCGACDFCVTQCRKFPGRGRGL